MSFEHIFNQLEISAEPFALCELKGACQLGLGRDASATLHYILAGEGEIYCKDRPPLQVASGSLVFIPALQTHSLRSFGHTHEPLPECRPAELKLAHLMKGDRTDSEGSNQLVALCAHVSVGLKGATNLIDLVREPLVDCVRPNGPLAPTLGALLHEVSQPGLGSQAMIRAILLQAVISLLRERLTQKDSALHWMAALKDKSVWNALQLMLDKPGDPHSVDSLAESVFMSRSAFAKKFSDAYGAGPMELLRDLRLRMAGTLLRDTDLPVKRIAEMVGFASRSAFTRMFESKSGLSPRAFRQEQIKS